MDRMTITTDTTYIRLELWKRFGDLSVHVRQLPSIFDLKDPEIVSSRLSNGDEQSSTNLNNVLMNHIIGFLQIMDLRVSI